MPVQRSSECPCCQTVSARGQWGLVSPFLASRAMNAPVVPTWIFECGECGHRWTERGLSEDEAARLYAGYRGEDYFQLRHSFEPWYTRSVNDGRGSEATMVERRAILARLLGEAGLNGTRFELALDWGGDRGQMLKELPATRRAVHEVSEVRPDPGIEQLRRLEDAAGLADLVLNCHVLEHLNDPFDGLGQCLTALRPGGHLYLELPCEPWRGPFVPPWLAKSWLERVASKRWLLMAMDFVSTASRISMRIVPPFGFVAVREHLNFFTLASAKRLVERVGLQPLLCTQPNADTLVVVARKTGA